MIQRLFLVLVIGIALPLKTIHHTVHVGIRIHLNDHKMTVNIADPDAS